jgi:hypothetical protein
LKEYNIKKIDVLHIDAEGHDNIVFSQFDFINIKPRIVMIEYKHLGNMKIYKIIKKLKYYNYQLFASKTDLLAIFN